jgi:peroxiredoxin Q/BCP
MGVERSTFLLDADGVIRKAWRKVKVDGHVDKVLEEAKKLSS